MKTFETDTLDLEGLDFDTQYAIYNGLDTLLTHELTPILMPEEGTPEGDTYYFERCLLPVSMGMTLRGIKVNLDTLNSKKPALEARIEALKDLLNKVATVIWGKGLNHNSYVQLNEIFYSVLDIPPQFGHKGGETKVTTDYDALTSISHNYVRGRFLAKIILRLRDLEKQFNVFNTKLSDDGRWHASFKIAGTNTGRFSSAGDAFDRGANLQNIDPSLRDIFVADPGMVLCYTDLKGAESMFVAYMTGDPAYMEAADSGDSHTLIASRIFKLPPKKEAVEVEYRNGKTYRDMSKMAQHACVTSGHEVLTRSGWVKVEDYDGTCEIAICDKLGNISFEEPARWNVSFYEGLVYHFYNKDYSQVVTPNHKFLWESGNGEIKTISANKLASVFEGALFYYKPEFSDEMFTTGTKLSSSVLYYLSKTHVSGLMMTCPYYKGKVYCPTVSTGYFVIRHNKMVSVCGNSNYTGTPFAIAMQSGVPVAVIEEFQKGYFKSFPGIKEWQTATIQELQTTGALVTPTGARRVFWGRLRSGSTIGAAMAYKPQGGIAHLMNMGMCRLHYGLPEAQLLAQIHDAVVFQLPEDRLDELLPKAIKLLEVPIIVRDIHGTERIMKVPVEANYGWNWGKYKKGYNEKGQREWKNAT